MVHMERRTRIGTDMALHIHAFVQQVMAASPPLLRGCRMAGCWLPRPRLAVESVTVRAARRHLTTAATAAAAAAAAVPWLHSLTRWQQTSGTTSSSLTDLASPLPLLSQRQQHDGPPPLFSPPTDADAIVVLAGGQIATGSGLPPWVERRLDTSLALQRLQAGSSSCPIVCLGGWWVGGRVP